MSAAIGLNEVPQTFLDPKKWAELRAFASNDLIALTYLNAPYPDQDDPCDFFWGKDWSFDVAVKCYKTGRELVQQCRRMLINRRLVATCIRADGTREMIMPIDWTNLWPMFATNRATGPDHAFDQVEILESTALETADHQILLDCISWLSAQNPTVLSQKKTRLLHQAKIEIGADLTQSTFDAAYKAVLGRSPGRPRK
jgi:hypothetical protein